MVTCSKNASAPNTIISANSTPFKKFIFFNGGRPLLFSADEIFPRSERQVPAVSAASPWNQRNSFWISVSSATEYPSFWQMDSICLFGIPVFGFFEFKISDIWQQLGYRTKLRTTGLMALPMDVGILSAYKIEVH